MKNILIITYWSFKDALIQTYTLPYVELIRKNLDSHQEIYLVTLEQESSRMNKEEWNSEKDKFSKKNIHLIRFRYSRFGIFMIIKFTFIFTALYALLFAKKVSHIHTWCTPAGVIGYLLAIISRKKLTLDSFEPHAEPMLESGTWSRESFKFKILFWLEKKQVQRANQVISCVPSMRDYVKEKYDCDLINSYDKPACIDFDLFDIEKVKNKELTIKYELKGKVIGVYAGKFEGSYLKEEVFEFVKTAENFWGKDKFRFILLTSHTDSFVKGLVERFNLNKDTIIQLFVPHYQVPDYIGLADFGLTPFIPVPSKRYGSPIKTGEYMAMGLPIVITKNISDDSDLIEKEGIGYVLQELSTREYKNACSTINDLIRDQATHERIRSLAIKYKNFDLAANVYQSIYGVEGYYRSRLKNVLILTYWSFKDALIQTYTLPYVRMIKKNIGKHSRLYLFTLEQQLYEMNSREWDVEKRKLQKENIYIIRFKYSKFGFKMIFKLVGVLMSLYKLIMINNINLIHAWCTPGGAIGYVLSKMTHSKLIIDSYEPHAESMVENRTWSAIGLKFRLMFWLEQMQSRKAKTVIALTQGMRTYAQEKYKATFDHYFIKPALVNFEKFNWNKVDYIALRREKNIEGKVVCVYAGKLGGIYLEEEVFDFFKVASDFWGDKFKVFLLTDKNSDEVNAFIQQKNIPVNCIESLFVNHNEIQNYYQMADFAINPVKPVPSKRYCTSIKDGEYWAMGLPVVITKDISDDSDIINGEDIGYVLQEMTIEEYVNACEKITDLMTIDSDLLSSKIKKVAKRYRDYSIAENIYEEIYF